MTLNYPDPRTVLTPKGRIKNLDVLHNGGENSWSLASMIWDNVPVLAMRWNGGSSSGKPGLGTPQARGHPTWFVLPSELGDVIQAAIKVPSRSSATGS
jgi:hypothetical protein